MKGTRKRSDSSIQHHSLIFKPLPMSPSHPTTTLSFSNQNACISILVPVSLQHLHDMRRKYDKKQTIPLHVNLFFPFVHEMEYYQNAWRDLIWEEVQHLPPFNVSLPAFYSNANSKYILMQVVSEKLQELRGKLELAFSSKMKHQQNLMKFVHPSSHKNLHVTIGMARSSAEAAQLVQQYNNALQEPYTFTCSELVYMVRKKVGDKWRVSDRIALLGSEDSQVS